MASFFKGKPLVWQALLFGLFCLAATPATFRYERKIKRALALQSYTQQLSLDLQGLYSVPSKEVTEEADRLAGAIVERLKALRDQYGMFVFYGLNNWLVALQLKDKGFCFHWTQDLLGALLPERWGFFDLYWGGAYVNRYREHNTTVITRKGEPFHRGILIDPWRSSGRVFWTKVEGDRYPWKIRPLPSKISTDEPISPLE